MVNVVTVPETPSRWGQWGWRRQGGSVVHAPGWLGIHGRSQLAACGRLSNPDAVWVHGTNFDHCQHCVRAVQHVRDRANEWLRGEVPF